MLARNVTKWTKHDDIKLYHLMNYVNSTKDQNLIGWVGVIYNHCKSNLRRRR